MTLDLSLLVQFGAAVDRKGGKECLLGQLLCPNDLERLWDYRPDWTRCSVESDELYFFFDYFSKSSKHKNTHMNIIFKYTISDMNPGNWFIMICTVYPDLSVPILRILKKAQ